MNELEKAKLTGTTSGQTASDKARALSRESENTCFILGFRMAMNLMSECLG